VLVAAWLGLFCWILPLAGRRRSLFGVSGSLVGAEAVLHVLFCRSAGTGTPGSAGDGPSGAVALAQRLLCGGHATTLSAREAGRLLQQAGIASSVGSGASTVHTMTMPAGTARAMAMDCGLLPSPGMIAAHLAAGLLLGLLLWRGDEAVWALMARPSSLLAPALAVLLPVVARETARLSGAAHAVRAAAAALARDVDAGTHPREPWVRHAVVRRGPPTTSLVA
jgi:hypothetical protein